MYRTLLALTGTTTIVLTGCGMIQSTDTDSDAYRMGHASGMLVHDADPAAAANMSADEITTRCGVFRDGAHDKAGMPDDADHNIEFMEGCRAGIHGEAP